MFMILRPKEFNRSEIPGSTTVDNLITSHVQLNTCTIISDAEDHLHANDSDWERSHRASAISAVRDARELTRRGKFGGYMDVRDGDEDSEVILHGYTTCISVTS